MCSTYRRKQAALITKPVIVITTATSIPDVTIRMSPASQEGLCLTMDGYQAVAADTARGVGEEAVRNP